MMQLLRREAWNCASNMTAGMTFAEKDSCKKSVPSIQQNFSDDDYLWPIPLTDMRLNPLLTQNPGYAGPAE